MKKRIAVVPGDGIGPEVIKQAIKVLEAVSNRYNHEFTLDYALMGAIAIDETGEPLPEETVDICLMSDAVLFGAIGHPKFDNDPRAKVRPEQGLLRLRKALGLYANIRPVRLFNSLVDRSPLKKEHVYGTNLVVFRELTSGIYFGDKGRIEGGNAAFDTCYYNVKEIKRVAKMAFQAASSRRGLLTLVDKANVLESSRLWREVVQNMALEYPDVLVDYLFVDNAAMQVVQQPSRFDVILTENMFGDIISDETSVITGSIGLLPSASLGLSSSLFEPIHGSYPEATGKDIANPLATILSLAMLLEHVELVDEARRVEAAVELVIDKGLVTPDLNKEHFISCSKVGDIVAMMVESDLDEDTSFDNIFEGNLPLI